MKPYFLALIPTCMPAVNLVAHHTWLAGKQNILVPEKDVIPVCVNYDVTFLILVLFMPLLILSLYSFRQKWFAMINVKWVKLFM